jgi:hypothetical protein
MADLAHPFVNSTWVHTREPYGSCAAFNFPFGSEGFGKVLTISEWRLTCAHTNFEIRKDIISLERLNSSWKTLL